VQNYKIFHVNTNEKLNKWDIKNRGNPEKNSELP
jgi:hypothetical protein